ncbi:MAG: glutamate--tRNA ligase, partial [Desulfobacterales bacterium]|nr:glutamate--tRNA ligase [Desulfobacterales bacterium]
MKDTVRVRFAPSPTGFLHIGNARTALYNKLFALQHDGAFILRIEDTDAARLDPAAEAAIMEDLRWMGLVWDEGPAARGKYGPYRQSERTAIYQEYAQRLLREEKAYPCFCTPEELAEMRELLLARGQPPRYSGRCRGLSPEQAKELEGEGRKPSLRFKVPDGATVVRDLIHGKKVFENKLMGDFVIMRSDGGPAYNFAAVVDDASMGITHVIRGEDHLPNTPRQILLYEALGFAPPRFAHHPFLVAPDGEPLSKRHGAVSVQAYRDEGFLP